MWMMNFSSCFTYSLTHNSFHPPIHTHARARKNLVLIKPEFFVLFLCVLLRIELSHKHLLLLPFFNLSSYFPCLIFCLYHCFTSKLSTFCLNLLLFRSLSILSSWGHLFWSFVNSLSALVFLFSWWITNIFIYPFTVTLDMPFASCSVCIFYISYLSVFWFTL